MECGIKCLRRLSQLHMSDGTAYKLARVGKRDSGRVKPTSLHDKEEGMLCSTTLDRRHKTFSLLLP